jgi:hypothetical protein
MTSRYGDIRARRWEREPRIRELALTAVTLNSREVVG